jgi:competence protein ComGF
MDILEIDFFFSLKEELTEIKNKKATWEEVAFHCQEKNFDIFSQKESKKVSGRINNFKRYGIPSKIQLLFLQSDFKAID